MPQHNTLQALFDLGEIDLEADWLDYAQLGITGEDAPQLLTLMGDRQLHHADPDSLEVWVPQHAWRALSQVGAGDCIAPMLALLDGELSEDIWVNQEMPQVIAKIGHESLDTLAAYLKDNSRNQGARTICAEGLKNIAEQTAGLRDPVVSILAEYLSAADSNAAELNGVVVCCLVDLKAVEKIEAIQGAYAAGLVDIAYPGDLSTVEFALGIRSDVDQVASKGSLKKQVQTPVTPHSLDEEINACLAQYGSQQSIKNVSALDGFFSALACAPDSVDSQTWLSAIWGDSDAQPHWQSDNEAHAFTSAVMVTYKRLVQALSSDTYSAYFHVMKEQGKHVTDVDDWCQGFMRGLNLWGYIGSEEARFLKQSVQTIRLFASDTGQLRLKQMDAAAIEAQKALIEPSVNNMYQYWFKQRHGQNMPVINSGAKAGRNDPCICGSGKKFKKCCLH